MTACSTERRGAVPAVLPVAADAGALGGGQLRQADVVQQGALGDKVGEVPDLVLRDPARDEHGTDEGVLTGEEFTGAADVDQGASLLVHLHAVEGGEVGQQREARIHEVVVVAEGLGDGDGAALDGGAQGRQAVEGVQDRREPQ